MPPQEMLRQIVPLVESPDSTAIVCADALNDGAGIGGFGAGFHDTE